MRVPRILKELFLPKASSGAEDKQQVLDFYIGTFDRAAQEGVYGVLKFMNGYAEKADNINVDPRITPVLKSLRDAGYMPDKPLIDDGSASYVAMRTIQQAISQMQELGGTPNPVMTGIGLRKFEELRIARAYSKFET